ncbi:lipid A 1-phosphatase LpxE [Ruegeria sp. ANG-R]|uniref:lipid A 1-phosphatase LpxE n=1 Tax=Ruegeria sp. ANG-R TaxID=1577903 RepID=UPI0009E37FF4|nr:lipid A 1-phosphatase LpxE [Ruegeria sp. ANG-R]
MRFSEVLRMPQQRFLRHPVLFTTFLLSFLVTALYPSDINGTYAQSKNGRESEVVVMTEDYGRFINTALQIAVPLVLRDATGFKQLLVSSFAVAGVTHGGKYLFNNVNIMGTRVGQRPHGPQSNHNMPSGHSSMASTAAYFLMRRYSIWFGLIVLPVLFLTMYARIMLDAHTMSGVIAGALAGIAVTALFATKRKRTASTARRHLRPS